MGRTGQKAEIPTAGGLSVGMSLPLSQCPLTTAATSAPFPAEQGPGAEPAGCS